MATYKVLQDIESEDKLFGPFTLKQFIFAAITIIIGFVGFRIMAMGVPIFVKIPAVLVLLPFFAVFGFLAAPLGRDQPNDIWLLARLRFLFKPRNRIWSQEGVSQLVTITAPKKVETVVVNSYSQTEVESRLTALANTLDSRGWAVKNVNTNLFSQPGYLTDETASSDRLVAPVELPQDVPAVEVLASDDMLDPRYNSTAQHLDQLMQQSTAAIKNRAADHLKNEAANQQSAPSQDFWFMNQPDQTQANLPQDYAMFNNQQVVTPGSQDAVPAANATIDEEELAKKLSEDKKQTSSLTSERMKVIQPLHDRDGNIIRREPEPAPAQPIPAPVQPPVEHVSPAVQALSQNDDLNISTISREAKRIIQKEEEGEVTINIQH